MELVGTSDLQASASDHLIFTIKDPFTHKMRGWNNRAIY